MLAALASFAGCQSYQRHPLNLDEAKVSWLARTPEHQNVRSLALQLAESAGASPTYDPNDGLSLHEGEVVALVFNADLRQSRLEAGVATAHAAYAGLWEDPVLGVDFERVVRSAGGANPWVGGGTLGLTVPISGRLEAAKSHADARACAELDRVATREWATRAALRELWVEWSGAGLREEITRDLIAKLREVALLADQQELAGTISRLDARLFRVELAGRESDLLALEGRHKELNLQLLGMLGLAPNAGVTLVPTVSIAAPAETDENVLLSRLEHTSPELAALRSQYEVAEQSLRTEVRKQYPDLVIGPGYGRDRGDDRVLLGMQLALPLWNRNQQGVAGASAEREAARGRFESTYEHLATNLAVALTRYRSGRHQREAIESTVVPLVDQQESDARQIAQLGRVDPLLLLESLKSQHAAKLRLVDARVTESLGLSRVIELVGPPVRESTRVPALVPATHTHETSPTNGR